MRAMAPRHAHAHRPEMQRARAAPRLRAVRAERQQKEPAPEKPRQSALGLMDSVARRLKVALRDSLKHANGAEYAKMDEAVNALAALERSRRRERLRLALEAEEDEDALVADEAAQLRGHLEGKEWNVLSRTVLVPCAINKEYSTRGEGDGEVVAMTLGALKFGFLPEDARVALECSTARIAYSPSDEEEENDGAAASTGVHTPDSSFLNLVDFEAGFPDNLATNAAVGDSVGLDREIEESPFSANISIEVLDGPARGVRGIVATAGSLNVRLSPEASPLRPLSGAEAWYIEMTIDKAIFHISPEDSVTCADKWAQQFGFPEDAPLELRDGAFVVRHQDGLQQSMLNKVPSRLEVVYLDDDLRILAPADGSGGPVEVAVSHCWVNGVMADDDAPVQKADETDSSPEAMVELVSDVKELVVDAIAEADAAIVLEKKKVERRRQRKRAGGKGFG